MDRRDPGLKGSFDRLDSLSHMDESILLVQDDVAIAELTAKGLEQAGFAVTKEQDGRQAVIRFRQGDFTLVVLDIMLPSLDGLEVCREIRRDTPAPIIMLTAKADPADIVLGLEAGADDYVTKPFEMPVLVARVRALLRRTSDDTTDEIRVGGLEIDVPGHKAFKRGTLLELSATEFRLLLALAQRPGQVLTREVLLDIVWDYDYLGDSRVVDMAIKRLREKVEDEPSHPKTITTVRGVGYRLDKD